MFKEFLNTVESNQIYKDGNQSYLKMITKKFVKTVSFSHMLTKFYLKKTKFS